MRAPSWRWTRSRRTSRARASRARAGGRRGGNRGTASAEIEVVVAPDLTPPSVGLRPARGRRAGRTIARREAPPTTAASRVRFLFGATALGEDAVPPYEAAFTVPADAIPGTSLELDAEAYDAEGNVGRARAPLAIVVAPDTAAPSPVARSAPARARPRSGRRQARATRAASRGRDSRRRDRRRRHQRTLQAGYTVPRRSARLGLEWTARASAPGGRAGFSPRRRDRSGVREWCAAVYDDARSQPLAGARVRVLEAGSSPLAPHRL
jgi:hypothetical protein